MSYPTIRLGVKRGHVEPVEQQRCRQRPAGLAPLKIINPDNIYPEISKLESYKRIHAGAARLIHEERVKEKDQGAWMCLDDELFGNRKDDAANLTRGEK